jgi:hypothetical protein
MANSCTRNLTPDAYTPGSPTTVNLTVQVDPATAYIVEEIYPPGWVIGNISPAAVDNGTSIRWLGFSSGVLSYTATPPGDETGSNDWGGTASFDGPGGFEFGDIGGETSSQAAAATTTSSPATTAPPGATTVVRAFDTPTYTPDVAFGVTLDATVGSGDAATYIVEEFTPFGWEPSAISNGGVFNGTSIRWFFLDANSRTLSYQITPPLDETACRSFAGHGLFDGGPGFFAVAVTGDTSICQGAAPPVRDLRTIGSGAGSGAGENMSSEIEHYGDGSLRPPAGPDEIGAMPPARDSALLVSEDIDAGQLINIFDDGGVAKARLADQSSSRPAHGWAASFASVGDAVVFHLYGSVDNRLSGLTPGSEYFLAEDGGIDTDAGASPISQKVGVALSASQLLFMPEPA